MVNLARQLALDLGTAHTRVHLRGAGLVVDEPTVVLMERFNAGVKAFGNRAYELSSHDDNPHTESSLVHPVRNGVAGDAATLEAFLTGVLKPYTRGVFDRQHAVVSVPSAASPIERRIVRECISAAGVDNVHAVEHVLAGALGINLPLHDAVGSMIVDVGAGIVEAALLSLGAVVAASNARVGTASIDDDICSLMRREYGMEISPLDARELQFAVAQFCFGNSRSKDAKQPLFELHGYSLSDGSSVTAIIDMDEIKPLITAFFDAVIEVIRATLIQAPPDLGQDLFSEGIHLIGGGSYMPGLVREVEKAFGLPVVLADEPELAIVRGAAICLEAPEAFSSMFLGEKSQV